MFDAGSAVFTLTGAVVREPFDRYGKLVEVARSQKEHSIVLGAQTNLTGFERFTAALDKVKQSVSTTVATVKTNLDGVSRVTNAMAVAVDRDLGTVDKSLKTTGKNFEGVGVSAKDSSKVVVDSLMAQQDATVRAADVTKSYSNTVVESNAKVVASHREAALAAGGGGRGSIPGIVGTGGTGGSSEAQAKKATKAWKDGFTTLANIGKWVSLGILGAGAISVKMAADFQRQMELVHTQAGYSQVAVDSLTKSVKTLAPQVGIGPTKLAEALFHIASSGIPAAKAMDILTIAAEGSKVGNADLESVTNALVATMRTAPKDIHSAGEAMAVMNDIVGHGNLRMEELTGALSTGILPAAKAVGLGMRDVGAALDVMTARGVPAQEGATRLRTVLGLIANPTNKAQKALDELGFSGDRLAKDFRSKGIVGALEDVQTSMGRVFGHKLDADQMRAALTAYADQLKASGASANTITKDLVVYKHQLDETGSGAIKATQLIAQAFGGARMGTTMQILMQNIDDVKKHVNDLNQSGASQRFQSAWEATQKDFSVQASKLGASVQVLGISFGEYLIPKVEASVKWLIQAGHWMGQHKTLADALAIAIGVTLTAAIVAFFARFAARVAGGVANIGKFGKSIYDLPKIMAEASAKISDSLAKQRADIEANTAALQAQEDQAAATGSAVAGMGTEGALGGGIAHEAEGAIGGGGSTLLGMINGALLGPESPGSRTNPIAVVIMAGEQFLGSSAAATGGKSLASEEGALVSGKGTVAARDSGLILPSSVSRAEQTAAMKARGFMGPGAGQLVGSAATSEAAAAEVMAASGGLGVMGAAKGAGAKVLSAGSKLMGGAMMAGMGVLASQLAGGLIGGSAGKDVSTIGTGTAIGAGIGSLAGPIGTAVGAAVGGIGTALIHFLGQHTDYGNQVTQNLTKGFATPDTRATVAKLLNDAAALNHPSAVAVPGRTPAGRFAAPGSGTMPGIETPAQKAKAEAEQFQAGQDIAKQLEAGWSQYKFQSQPIMFEQLRAEIKGLPPVAQAGGIESALAYTKGLEKNGKLPAGSFKVMIDQIKSQFPGFDQYLGIQGSASVDTFYKALDFKNTEKNVNNQLKAIASDFPQVQAVMEQTGLTVDQKAAGIVLALKDIVNHGSGPASAAASADLQHLQQSVSKSLNSAASLAEAKAKDMRDSLANGTGNALEVVKANFNAIVTRIRASMRDGTTSVVNGVKVINQVMTDELKALGMSVPKGLTLTNAELGGLLGLVTKGGTGASSAGGSSTGGGSGHGTTFAMGGMLPGSEFGHTDQMTLVDPHGNPRARMAGDESVFTKHQMPFVEAGLQMLGFGGAHDLWGSVTTPHSAFAGGGNLGKATGVSRYINPFPPGTIIGRTDQGVDANMPVGAPIGPMGNALVEKILPNWYKGQPLVYWKLLDGARRGQYGYVAEQINQIAAPGTRLSADQAVAHYAPTGTGIEYGWATSSGATLARVTSGYKEGQVTPAGSDMLNFIHSLATGKLVSGPGAMFGGTAGSFAPSVPKMKAPKIKSKSLFGSVIQAALNSATSVGNQFMQNTTGSFSAAGFTGGGNNVANEALGRKMMLAAGWPASQWPFLKALWSQESGWDANSVNSSSGAYGIPQALGHGHPFNLGDAPAQIAWGLNYIRGRYGSPSAAEAHERANNWYAGGGPLSGVKRLATGGIPSLPSGTGYIPGHRPPRERKTRAGIKVVGGKGTSGRTGRGTTTAGPKVSTKQVSPVKQSISQTVAAILDDLGLGSFVNDQNTLGKLETKYTNQSNIYNTFDQGSGSLPLHDLNVLMGIREQEWDILSNEYTQLPSVISKLKAIVAGTEGPSALKGVKPGDIVGIMSFGGPSKATVGATSTTTTAYGSVDTSLGVTGLTAEIQRDEADVLSLETAIKNETRTAARDRHKASASIMNLADSYAQQLALLVNNQGAIADQRTQLSRQRATLSNQLSSLTGTKAAPPSIGSIVSTVMGGGTVAPTSSTSATKKKIHNQLNALRSQETGLSTASRKISQQIASVRRAQQAADRKYRKQGFDQAWAIQLTKWKLADRLTALRAKIKALQAALKIEQSALKNQTSALTTVEGWLNGGLQGTGSIGDSLSQTGQDMLTLYQQGANLPTPGRKSPTLAGVENMLKQLGIDLPAGLTGIGGPSDTATAAFADFAAFQASRAALFSQFGGNFSPAGTSPFGSAAGLGAGTQFFGAASGSAAGAGAPGGAAPGLSGGGMISSPSGPGATTVEITQNFRYGPPDPHTHAQGLAFEMEAAV